MQFACVTVASNVNFMQWKWFYHFGAEYNVEMAFTELMEPNVHLAGQK